MSGTSLGGGDSPLVRLGLVETAAPVVARALPGAALEVLLSLETENKV